MSVEKHVDLSRWIGESQLGGFIGQKGCHIKTIEKAHKMLLNVENNLRVRVTGRPRSVDLAIVDIELHALDILSRNGRHSFLIPTERVGYLIGRHGQKINGIKNDSRAKIELGRAPRADGTTEVSVRGTFAVILSAVGMIKDRLDSFGQDFTPYSRPDKEQFLESWDEVIHDN